MMPPSGNQTAGLEESLQVRCGVGYGHTGGRVTVEINPALAPGDLETEGDRQGPSIVFRIEFDIGVPVSEYLLFTRLIPHRADDLEVKNLLGRCPATGPKRGTARHLEGLRGKALDLETQTSVSVEESPMNMPKAGARQSFQPSAQPPAKSLASYNGEI